MTSQKINIAANCNETDSIISFIQPELVGLNTYQADFGINDEFFGNEKIIQQNFHSKFSFPESAWAGEDQKQLIELHKEHGNKWTLLARSYPGMCQNSIKNRFYSRLRKSIRKLNKAIKMTESKKYNAFKLNIIFKLSNISEGKMAEKEKIVPQIFQFYREFLYKLIDFSDQNQNENLSKQSFQNITDIENLILPLVALENLFRLVRGERVAKGKKKNIAYLRQFRFRLSLQNQAEMVITKQSILLANGNEKPEQIESANDRIQQKGRNKSTLKDRRPKETSRSDNQTYENPKFYRYNTGIDIEQSEDATNRPMSPFKEVEEVDCNTQTQIWKDYFGRQLKEYDIFENKEVNFDLAHNFEMFSFKSSNFIDENSIW